MIRLGRSIIDLKAWKSINQEVGLSYSKEESKDTVYSLCTKVKGKSWPRQGHLAVNLKILWSQTSGQELPGAVGGAWHSPR